VCCAACGELARLDGRQAAFRCARCDRDQSTAPPPKVEKVVAGVQRERKGYDELSAFAETVGVKGPVTSLDLTVDGLETELSLDIDSGRVRGLDMSMRGKLLPEVRFRRETMSDRDAKETGVARELQTGDQTFDDAVYIESDAADADLLLFLSSPHVRAAIVELLRSFEDLQLHPDRIEATRNFGQGAFHPDAIWRCLELLRLVVGTTRSLAPAPMKTSASWLVILTGLCLPVGWTAFGVSAYFLSPFDLSLIWLSFGVGLLLALIAWPVYGRLIRGRSTSHNELGVARIGAFTSFPALVATIALLSNAKLDASASRVRTLTVTSVDYDTEDHISKTSARGHGIGPWSFHFRDPNMRVQVGQRVTVKSKPGALGFEWPVSAASVETVEGPLSQD
jgi:hypothetical protein